MSSCPPKVTKKKKQKAKNDAKVARSFPASSMHIYASLLATFGMILRLLFVLLFHLRGAT